MAAILAAIAFGIGFILELLKQPQHYIWLALLAGLFFVAIALIPVIPAFWRARQ